MIRTFTSLLVASLLGSASLVMAQDHDRPSKPGGGGRPDGGQNRKAQMTRPDMRPDVRPDVRPDMARGNAKPGDRPDRAPMIRPGGNDMRPQPQDRPGMGNPRPAPPVTIMPARPGRDQNGRNDDRSGGSYSYNRPPPGNYWRPGNARPAANWWQNGRWNQRPVYAPAYQYPQGYSYRRWSPGLILPSLFFGSSFFFEQFFDLGLPSPPYGYRWVRYGPDLLLVNTRTGRIRDVRYGVFG